MLNRIFWTPTLIGLFHVVSLWRVDVAMEASAYYLFYFGRAGAATTISHYRPELPLNNL